MTMLKLLALGSMLALACYPALGEMLVSIYNINDLCDKISCSKMIVHTKYFTALTVFCKWLVHTIFVLKTARMT